MKSNEIKGIDYENESSLYMALPLKDQPPTDTKIIVINPIITTSCQESTNVHSILYDGEEIMSQSTQTIRLPPQHPFLQEEEHYQPYWQEQQQSSIRKLYKEMKRQEQQEEEPVHFLYQSDRGESPMEGSIKLQPVQYTEVQKHEGGIMTSKNSNEILYQEIPAKGMIECVVKVASSSLLSMQKHIQLYLMKEKKLLLRAKKNRLAVSSLYEVNNVNHTVATFHSNPSRTEYKYLKTALPQKEDNKPLEQQKNEKKYDSALIKLNPVKVELSSLTSPQRSYLVFRQNMLGIKQQRLKIIRPRIKVGKSQRFSDIKASYENFQYDRLEIFENKLAEKNIKGELILDFKTDKIMESSRNIIIEDQTARVCMTFYKRKENLYMMSVMRPFTIIEGFFIAVSNLDHLFF